MSCLARENVAVNAEMDLSRQTFHTGAEWQINPLFSLRGGFDQVAEGAGTVFNPGLGIGLNFKGVKFDYAYYSDQILAGNSAHYFTLGFTSGTL